MNKLLAIRQNQMEKRENKKGFTLVEVIVVLVILAILAAILIPSMIGWINKAEDKSAIVEGRTFVLAAQTIVSENYTAYTTGGATSLTGSYTGSGTTSTGHVGEAAELADVGIQSVTSTTVSDGKVTGAVIVSSGGKTVTYNGTDYTITTP